MGGFSIATFDYWRVTIPMTHSIIKWLRDVPWSNRAWSMSPEWGIWNITFKYLLEMICPIVGWCPIGIFSKPCMIAMFIIYNSFTMMTKRIINHRASNHWFLWAPDHPTIPQAGTIVPRPFDHLTMAYMGCRSHTKWYTRGFLRGHVGSRTVLFPWYYYLWYIMIYHDISWCISRSGRPFAAIPLNVGCWFITFTCFFLIIPKWSNGMWKSPTKLYGFLWGWLYNIYNNTYIYIIIYNKIHKIIYTYENFGEGISMD